MDYKLITKTINIINDYISIVTVILFLYKKAYKSFPYLFSYLLITQILLYSTRLVIDLALLGYLPMYNLYLYHLIGLFELILVYKFYQRQIILPHILTKLFPLIIVIYIANSLFLENYMESINAYGRSLSTLYLLCLGFSYLYNIYKKELIIDIKKDLVFWFNGVFMIYLATSFLAFLFSRKILSLELSTLFSAGWVLHSIAYIFMNIIFWIALLLFYKKKTNWINHTYF